MDAQAFEDLRLRAERAAQERWPQSRLDDLVALEGGHSGLTFRADIQVPGLNTRRAVVKVAPPGRPARGRHDVLRQARLLTYLDQVRGVGVPSVLFTGPGAPPFFAMAWVDGQAWEPVLDETDERPPPDVVRSRGLGASQMLAALHAAPVEGPLTQETPASPGDELERWAATMDAVDPELRPRAADLATALRQSVPAAMGPAVVHGDYRLGNILCNGPEPVAIIDWEIWSIADPRVDLGWFLVFSDPQNLPVVGLDAPGIPPAGELLTAYEDRWGVTLPDMAWFHALGRYKMAAIMGHNLRRHREGRFHDPYQERLPECILSLVDQGLDIVA